MRTEADEQHWQLRELKVQLKAVRIELVKLQQKVDHLWVFRQ